MKKASSYLVVLCMFLNISLFADNTEERKLYLESGDIKVTPEGIFLDCNGTFLPINIVGKDEHGAFVTAYIDQAYIVICATCGFEVNLDTQESQCPHPTKKYP